MGKYLGYLVIILIHFGIKGCQYSEMEKTTGVVVEERSFAYGRMSGRGGRDIVPYPVVKFKGPVTTKEIKKRIYKPEDHTTRENAAMKYSQGIEIDNVGELTEDELIHLAESVAHEFERQEEFTENKVFETSYEETDEYLTETPWGAYFFRHFDTGEELPVIYYRDNPEGGIVYSFFSFWLHLRAICFILLACIVWTGLYRIVKGQVI